MDDNALAFCWIGAEPLTYQVKLFLREHLLFVALKFVCSTGMALNVTDWTFTFRIRLGAVVCSHSGRFVSRQLAFTAHGSLIDGIHCGHANAARCIDVGTRFFRRPPAAFQWCDAGGDDAFRITKHDQCSNGGVTFAAFLFDSTFSIILDGLLSFKHAVSEGTCFGMFFFWGTEGFWNLVFESSVRYVLSFCPVVNRLC